MKKTSMLFVMFIGALLFFIPAASAATSTSFSDVNKSFWAIEEIEHFAEYEIVNGYGNGKFLPNKAVTRAEGAIMLARGLELDTKSVKSVDYKDLNQDHFAYNEIAAVTNAGIMQGNKGKFQPNKPLTRAEMVTMLVNAFEFEGSQNSSFKDVAKDDWFYEAVNVAVANKLATGYGDKTFKPSAATKRAEFVVFFSRALNSSTPDLLKEVYANEMEIDTYEFESNLDLGLTFPEGFFATPEEEAMFAEMLSNIQVDITGAYQKDPMLMEATLDLTLTEEMKFSMPMVMTTDKIWFKYPETPLVPVPEELKGKFVEMDLAELAEESGQPAPTVDIELQTKLNSAITQLFVDYFGKDFYSVVPTNTVEAPNGVDVKTVVEFELNERTLKPFMEILFEGFLPEFVKLLDDPEYAEAMGLTPEDVAEAKAGLAEMSALLDDMLVEMEQVVTINEFKELIYINQEEIIGYDKMNLDLTVNAEGEEIGFNLFFDQKKLNINEEVEINIPDEEDTITMDELMEIEEGMIEVDPEV